MQIRFRLAQRSGFGGADLLSMTKRWGREPAVSVRPFRTARGRLRRSISQCYPAHQHALNVSSPISEVMPRITPSGSFDSRRLCGVFCRMQPPRPRAEFEIVVLAIGGFGAVP